MLTSELDRIWYLSERPADRDYLEAEYLRITGVWQEAAFSDRPDHSLARYFNFHLQGISKLSDTLFPDQPGPDLPLRLADYLLENFSRYLDADCPAPAAYRRRLVARLNGQVAPLSLPGYPFLAAYIAEVSNGTAAYSFSFRALRYFETLVTALSSSTDIGGVLLEMNFNHLGYLADCQKTIGNVLGELTDPAAKLAYLQQEKSRIIAVPIPLNLVYHPDWPSLGIMLVSWLSEQIAALPGAPAAIQKLPLNFSVAQLACLVRLCYEEDFFKEPCLTTIFDFTASAYTSKRQSDISPGSLSKHYYSTDQVTAAVMRGKLLRMVARINKNFFPV
jgi:hypothetical protein